MFWLSWVGSDLVVLIFIFFSGSVFAYSLGSVCACGDRFLLDYFPVFNLIMRLMAASAWGMDAVNHVA